MTPELWDLPLEFNSSGKPTDFISKKEQELASGKTPDAVPLKLQMDGTVVPLQQDGTPLLEADQKKPRPPSGSSSEDWKVNNKKAFDKNGSQDDDDGLEYTPQAAESDDEDDEEEVYTPKESLKPLAKKNSLKDIKGLYFEKNYKDTQVFPDASAFASVVPHVSVQVDDNWIDISGVTNLSIEAGSNSWGGSFNFEMTISLAGGDIKCSTDNPDLSGHNLKLTQLKGQGLTETSYFHVVPACTDGCAGKFVNAPVLFPLELHKPEAWVTHDW